MNIQINQNTTVGELVIAHPQLRKTLEKLGIDYCCGGKKPLRIAAQEAGVPWSTVETALNETLEKRAETVARDWNTASLNELVDHIVKTHHAFTREQLVRLDGLLDKVEVAHGAHHGEMLAELHRIFSSLRSELEPHLMKEEQVLFPLIKQTEACVKDGGKKPVSHCGSVANPIQQMESEHEDAGSELATMRQLTNGYKLPDDACQTFTALYEGLIALENDLHLHIHLENNILFPKSIELEAKITN